MKKFHWLILIAIVVIGGLLYAKNLNDFFVSDDFDWLYLTATRSQNLWQYLTTNYYGQQGLGGSYRPMFNWLFAFDYAVWGLNPVGYHLSNLIFHLANIFLLYFLIKKIFQSEKLAVAASGLFALLPCHSEAVIWIAARGDVVVTFFFLLTWLLYEASDKTRWLFYLSLPIFVLALLTKEMAVVWPLIVVVSNYLQKKKFDWRILWYVLMVVGFFVARYLAIGLTAGYYADNTFQFSWRRIVLMLLNLTTDTFLFFETRLAVRDWLWDNRWLALLSVVIILTTVWWLFKKVRSEIFGWITIWLIMTLPLWSLIFGINNDEGERYQYLPSVAVVVILSLLVREIYRLWRPIGYFSLIGLMLYFGYFSWQKNLAWQAAATSSVAVLQDFSSQVNLSQTQHVWLINLPDTYRGAQVLRNGFDEALNLFYPDNQVSVERLPVWWLDINSPITATITADQDGYFLTASDYLFTGPARHETKDYYTELWGYNYNNYTSKQVKFFIKNPPDALLIFDGRKLQNVLY